MPCKLAVMATNKTRLQKGDVVGAFAPHEYNGHLGEKVESDDSPFFIVEITDADIDDGVIMSLVEPWKVGKMYHEEFDRQHYIDPVILTSHRLSVTISHIQENIKDRG